jgi:hypothetical protein
MSFLSEHKASTQTELLTTLTHTTTKTKASVSMYYAITQILYVPVAHTDIGDSPVSVIIDCDAPCLMR